MEKISEQFLAEVEAFLARTKMGPTAFGRQALKNPGFVLNLRRGLSPSLTTVDKVRAFMADYK